MGWTVMKMAGSFLSSALFKFLLTALLGWSVLSGAELLLERPAPVFREPNVFSRRIDVLPPGRYEVAGEAERRFSVRHPIAYYAPFFRLEGGTFVSPCVTVDETSGENIFVPPAGDWRLWATALAVGLLGAVIFLLVKGKLRKTIPPCSVAESLCFILIAVLLRQILLLCEISFWGNAIPCAADEPGYFKTVADMLRGDFKGPWNFTIGLGLVYLPFVLLCGARDYYDIAVSFCHFNGLVLGPAVLAAAFLLLRSFGVGRRCAFAAILVWAVYPFFVYHAELWKTLSFAPFLAPPCFVDGAPDWWRFYSVCIHTGFNGMSDTPGLLAVLLTLLLARLAPPDCRGTFLTGLAYGFCCLLRINYVFFAPLIAFIWFFRLPERSFPSLLRAAGAALGGFFLVFGWQFLINIHHFGNPFTFGYSLHYLDFPPEKRPSAGFTWAILAELRNIKFLMGANKLLMAAGIAGLLFLRTRYTRIALTLLGVPLILFFFGYTHTYCDARRFIMAAYPAFTGAFCAAAGDCLEAYRRGGRGRLLLPGLPAAAVLFRFLPAEICALSLLLLLLRALFDLQREVSEVILKR